MLSFPVSSCMTAAAFLLTACLGGAEAGAQTLSPRDVEGGVAKSVQAALDDYHRGWQVENVYYRWNLELPDGEAEFRVELDGEPAKPGNLRIPVSVMVNGVEEKSFLVSAKVNRVISVPVLIRPLERGVVVGPGDLVWQDLETRRNLTGLALHPEALMGKMANRVIQPGTPLQDEWFSVPIAVERGTQVEVLLESGPLTIKTVGMALETGRTGETIQVRNMKTNRNFMAKVASPGLVRAVIR